MTVPHSVKMDYGLRVKYRARIKPVAHQYLHNRLSATSESLRVNMLLLLAEEGAKLATNDVVKIEESINFEPSAWASCDLKVSLDRILSGKSFQNLLPVLQSLEGKDRSNAILKFANYAARKLNEGQPLTPPRGQADRLAGKEQTSLLEHRVGTSVNETDRPLTEAVSPQAADQKLAIGLEEMTPEEKARRRAQALRAIKAPRSSNHTAS